MTSRTQFRIALLLLTSGVVFRTVPFVWWPGAHFDSDQATVGLMAKHISEGTAFPLFYYGQHYMLAIEAYLAAPVMWVIGPTVTALKLPLVMVNVAAVGLLLRLAARDGGLGPWPALIVALPLALPPALLAARTTEAMGGNVEPWLYVLLLWGLRARPFAFGSLLGVGMLHREFTAYGAGALLVMDALRLAGGPARWAVLAERSRHWTIAAIAWVASRAVVTALEPFSYPLGPGSRGTAPDLQAAVVDTLGGRLCFAPEAWSARASALVSDHLPRMMGGIGAPLRDYGVLTGVYSGQPGLGPWVGILTLLGLGAGAWHWWTHRNTRPTVTHLAGYLVIVGVISTLVYGFGTCSDIRVATLRYNLLVIFVPIGAVLMALQAWPAPAARAAVGAAVGFWCALGALDVAALTAEYQRHPPPDQRQVLADALVSRGITSARSTFRTAYHVTFLARERVRIDAADFSRIASYAEEAGRTSAPTIASAPCAGGEALPTGDFLCRPERR